MKDLTNKIICGDCIEILEKISEPFADLIFADPPFNIGYKYDKYYDRVKSKNYIEWTRQWMTLCKKVLKPTGSFYIAIGDDYAANVKIIADELGLFMRNWIIWHYTFGQQTKNKFARSHTHIFYFVKDKKNFVFNDHAVRVPSDRQLIYNDKRANPHGKMPDDVWTSYSRVCGTFKERTNFHPCQMPENLIKNIIAASSNPADLVFDPFSGSATTAAAALQMKRNYTGIEISEKYTTESVKRLNKIQKQIDLSANSQFYTKSELNRLLRDINIESKKISQDQKLLRIFTDQFSTRAGNFKKYKPSQIQDLLKDL